MNKKGFTLIEMTVVLLISAISMGGLYQVFINQAKTYEIQDMGVELQQATRFSFDCLVNDLRMAGPDCCGGARVLSPDRPDRLRDPRRVGSRPLRGAPPLPDDAGSQLDPLSGGYADGGRGLRPGRRMGAGHGSPGTTEGGLFHADGPPLCIMKSLEGRQQARWG
jgi:prepilin-type N-terminal cleavage/methylation domain-containing protein